MFTPLLVAYFPFCPKPSVYTHPFHWKAGSGTLSTPFLHPLCAFFAPPFRR